MILDIDARELEIGDELMVSVKVFNVRVSPTEVEVYLEIPTEIRTQSERKKITYRPDKIVIVNARRR